MTSGSWVLAVVLVAALFVVAGLARRILTVRNLVAGELEAPSATQPAEPSKTMAETSASAASRAQHPAQERRSTPDPHALADPESGRDKLGFNLEVLRQKGGEFKPLVEHLSYIQVQRGEQQSLIFVRQRDLESLAAMTGLNKDSFLEQFQEMGVLISMN